MEGEDDPITISAPESKLGISTNKKIIALAVLYSIALIIMAVWGGNWNRFKALYGLWFLLYLGLIYLIISSGALKRLEKVNPAWVIIFLFLLTVILHLPFLLKDPSMSQDILRLERRGELILDGKFPYRDFDVNKPPLYIWLVGLISIPFGPNQLSFRVFFTMISGLIPVAMYMIHRKAGKRPHDGAAGPFGMKVPGMDWMAGSFAYALCPIPILETALAGHFDPVVVLTTVVALYFLMRDRSLLSGLFLGLGFALKLYPMFLAPVFFLSLNKWKDRIFFTLAFFTVPVIASLPILMVDPALMGEYLRYQFVNWYTGFSIRYLLENILEMTSLPVKLAYWFLTAVLMGGLVYFLLRGMVGKLKRSDTFVLITFMLILSSMGLGSSTVFYYYGVDGPGEILFAVIGTIFSVVVPVAALYLYLHWAAFKKPSFKGLNIRTIFTKSIEKHTVPFISSCVLLLLVLTSAQFHPWYLAWILPFAFTSGNPYWSWSILLFFSSFQANAYPPWEMA